MLSGYETITRAQITFDKNVDIWSFGCILYALITGRKTFESDFAVFEFVVLSTKPELVLSVDQFNEPLRTGFTSPIDETIRFDYEKRPSVRSFTEAISNLITNYFPPEIGYHDLEICRTCHPSRVALCSILREVVKSRPYSIHLHSQNRQGNRI